MRHCRAARDGLVDHALDRAGRENFAGFCQQLARVDLGLIGEDLAGRRAWPTCCDRAADVEAGGVVERDRVVADADDFDAARARPSAACEPTLPKPWTIAVGLDGLEPQPLEGAKRQERDAVAGRLAPPERAARADRLAGDDLGHGDALVHRIGVHEPGHDLLVGAHVGRHHVDARADEGDHLLHVAARQVFQLADRQRRGVDRDAALAAAIGQVGERAFPAHPDRQRRDLADVDLGRKSRAALGRAQRQVVLHPVAHEDRGASRRPYGSGRRPRWRAWATAGARARRQEFPGGRR